MNNATNGRSLSRTTISSLGKRPSTIYNKATIRVFVHYSSIAIELDRPFLVKVSTAGRREQVDVVGTDEGMGHIDDGSLK
jgi:hypothetical protein